MLMVTTEIEGKELGSVYFSFVQWCGDIGGRKQDDSFSNIVQAHFDNEQSNRQQDYTNTTSFMFMPKYPSIGAYLL